jgi:hypothetical protein
VTRPSGARRELRDLRWRDRRDRRDRRDESGAVLVEFALILPLLMILLLGIIEFGDVYNNYISIRQGVREAARQGSVANFGTDGSCTLSLASSPSADLQKLMCLTKNQIGLPPGDVAVKILIADKGLATSGQPWKTGNGLVVCAQTKLTSISGFFTDLFASKYLKSKTTIRIEQGVPDPGEIEGFETAPTGGSWSWCTASSASP